MKILRLYKKLNGDLFQVIKYNGEKPTYDTSLYTEVEPLFNNNVKPAEYQYATQSFDKELQKFVAHFDYSPLRSIYIDNLYKIRDKYIYKNISYNYFEFVADSQAQNKIANMIFFALQIGKTDVDPVVDWDCVNGEYQDITLADLKNVAELMVTQEQTARAILRVLRSKYEHIAEDLLKDIDVEQDFENMLNSQSSLA